MPRFGGRNLAVQLTLEPRSRSTHHMNMKVMHLLAPFGTRVAQNTITPFGVRITPFLQGQLWCQHHHAAHQTGMLRTQLRDRRNVHLRNHQKVDWRPGIDVVEDKNFIVLVHHFGRYFSRHNFAKQATRVALNNRFSHATDSMERPLFIRTMPLTIRYKNQMEITHHAIQPGMRNNNHNGAVTA